MNFKELPMIAKDYSTSNLGSLTIIHPVKIEQWQQGMRVLMEDELFRIRKVLNL